MKETTDTIAVKRVDTGSMEMYRLHSDIHGVVGGQTLPDALRNLADTIELRQAADQIESGELEHTVRKP